MLNAIKCKEKTAKGFKKSLSKELQKEFNAIEKKIKEAAKYGEEFTEYYLEINYFQYLPEYAKFYFGLLGYNVELFSGKPTRLIIKWFKEN